MIRRLTIFCGSNPGTDPAFYSASHELGRIMARKKIGIVYGGAGIGLMGAVADGALSEGGEVTGVIPNFLMTKEIAHAGLTQLLTVDTMHERKSKMNELSDGIVALPGGFGTLEELFEMITWGQLGLHAKPMALFNIKGFFDPLTVFLQSMVDKGFVSKSNQRLLMVDNDVNKLLERMQHYVAPAGEKWISKETS